MSLGKALYLGRISKTKFIKINQEIPVEVSVPVEVKKNWVEKCIEYEAKKKMEKQQATREREKRNRERKRAELLRIRAAEKFPINTVIKLVADRFNFTVSEIKSVQRSKDLCHARHIACYIAKKISGRSLPEIGLCFGGRDHTTIMHAVRKVEKKMAADPSLVDTVEEIKAMLGSISAPQESSAPPDIVGPPESGGATILDRPE